MVLRTPRQKDVLARLREGGCQACNSTSPSSELQRERDPAALPASKGRFPIWRADSLVGALLSAARIATQQAACTEASKRDPSVGFRQLAEAKIREVGEVTD